MKPWAAAEKALSYHHLLSGSIAKSHFPPVSHQSRLSRLSANDKVANEMIPGAVDRSPGICLMTEENPGKQHLGNCLMKAVRSLFASNGVPYLQMRSAGSHSTSRREEEGRDGMTLICSLPVSLM